MNVWIIVLCMAAVTSIPRILPLYLMKNFDPPPLLRRFLRFIPSAALGALIFPGVLKAIPQMPAAAAAGMGAALITAWFGGGLVFSVGASVTVAFILLRFFV